MDISIKGSPKNDFKSEKGDIIILESHMVFEILKFKVQVKLG